MTLKIIADENIPGLVFSRDGGVELTRVGGRDIAPELVRDVDILLVRSVTRVDEALLSGSTVRFVGSATSGFDHIDRDYLRECDIAFAYAPGSNANAVVEYVLSAIAAIDNKLEGLLDGGTVGIVGYGCVGKALASRLAALGINYRVYDPWLDQQSISSAAALEDLLGSDVVSLHPELTRAAPWPSYHLLGKDELARLQPETLLINASRGAVVDNAALLAQLESGRGPVTVLDVWEGEPVPNPNLLQHVALGTAHIAGYSLDAKLRATGRLCDELATFLDQALNDGDKLPGDAPTIHVQQAATIGELLRALLHARYPIRDDDTLLRQAVLEQGNDGGAGFDGLRRHYRERRELAGSRVTGNTGLTDAGSLVAALGCDLEHPGSRNG